jgi:hypothetical protein
MKSIRDLVGTLAAAGKSLKSIQKIVKHAYSDKARQRTHKDQRSEAPECQAEEKESDVIADIAAYFEKYQHVTVETKKKRVRMCEMFLTMVCC